MKKLILILTLAFLSQFAAAQSNELFKKDVIRMLEVSSAHTQFKEAKEQILTIIPKENHAAFLVEFEASLQPIYDKFAALYMKEFTHADIKSILKFMESPLGKKMNQKSSVIMQEVFASSQEWATGVKALVTKHMNVKGATPPPPMEN